MLLYQMELIKHAHKTCMEFIDFESSGDHVGDQAHFHSTLEIILIREGSGVYKVGTQEYSFAMGDIFVFNSMEQHNIVTLLDDKPMKSTSINFDPRFISTMEPDDYDLQYLEAFLFSERPCRIESGSRYAQEISRFILDMQREFEEKRPSYPLVIKAILLAMLALLLRYYQEAGGSVQLSHQPIQTQDSIALVLDYIEKNLTSDLNIDKLSKFTSMNRYYFSTFFKKHVGETPIQYITRKRITMAIQLLKNSNYSVLEVAMRSGFNNTANFNRTFKQITGLSPTEYKKQNRPKAPGAAL